MTSTLRLAIEAETTPCNEWMTWDFFALSNTMHICQDTTQDELMKADLHVFALCTWRLLLDVMASRVMLLGIVCGLSTM